MSNAFNAGYRFKLSMYWGSKWKTYFGLYYAFTYEAAYTALKGYDFPISKNRGWGIEELATREVEFVPRESPDEGFTEAFAHDSEKDYAEDDSSSEQMPLMLPNPKPPAEFKSVWRNKPKGTRRL